MLMAEDINTKNVWYKLLIATAIVGILAPAMGLFGLIPEVWGDSVGFAAFVVIGSTMIF